MAKISIKLLGRFQVSHDAGDEILIPGRKIQALLAYLAFHVDHPQTRSKLATLLWGNRLDEQAAQSLRQSLFQLRKRLGDDESIVQVTDAGQVLLNSTSVKVDVAVFEQLVKEPTVEALADAAALFKGPLLDGLEVKEPVFEDWTRDQRVRLEALACDMLERLAHLHISEGNSDHAIETASHLVDLDPLQEEGHRILMRLYAQSNRRAQALRQFQTCADYLRRELDSEPEAETKQVFKDIKDKSASVPDLELEMTVPGKPSIAVLPFENLSADREQEYFADGLTDDIITALSRWRSFPVIARSSTFSYKHQLLKVQQIAEELGARYILEGSVRKSSKRIRVNARLIDALSGHHIWAETFDQGTEEIFELQDHITGRIAATVEPEIGKVEQRRSTTRQTKNLVAWDYFQRGMYLLFKFTPKDVIVAREMFVKALRLDPTYSQAQTGLAYSHQLEILHEYTDSRKNSITKLLESARRGVTLDDTDSFAHVMMAFAYRWNGQHDMAVSEAYRAVELNPNNAWALGTLGNVLDLAGNSREGIPYLKNTLLLNPRDAHSHFTMTILARAYLNIREYQAAIEWAHKAIQRNPDHVRAHLYLASSLGHLDRENEARDALNQCERIQPGFARKWARWREYRKSSDNDHLLEGLRRAGFQDE